MARPSRPEFHPRLADFRHYAALTQEQVADRIGITAEMVRRHERGTSFPIAKYRNRYSLLYNATEAELGLTLGRSSAANITESSSKRREVLYISPPSVPVHVSDDKGEDYLKEIRTHIDQIIALDNRFGGAELVKLSQRFFRTVRDQLEVGTRRSDVEKDIFAAAGELAEVTGWLAYDADQQQITRQMNQEALYFSRLAGDKKMELLTLQNLSMQAGFLNRPSWALYIAESVLNGDYQLSPRLHALFLTRKARARAQGGDESAVRLFDEIRSLYLEGIDDSDPAWAWWVDERELAWHEAMCRQDLGKQKMAIAHFEKSVEATPHTEVRNQYLHRAYLLGSQLDLGLWPAAEDSMRQLCPLVCEVASTRTVVLLNKIIVELKVSQRKVPVSTLQEVEKLTAALAAAPV